MRYMNEDKHFKVVPFRLSARFTILPTAASLAKHFESNRTVRRHRGGPCQRFVSHRFIDDQRAEEGMNSYTRDSTARWTSAW